MEHPTAHATLHEAPELAGLPCRLAAQWRPHCPLEAEPACAILRDRHRQGDAAIRSSMKQIHCPATSKLCIAPGRYRTKHRCVV